MIGEYKIKNDRMKKLNNEVNSYLTKLSDWSINHVRREKNMRADQLSKIGWKKPKVVNKRNAWLNLIQFLCKLSL
ncbi:hypothetical protein Ct9H90mP29_16960 [bacterium]|nr:MAG: hypothetical protein Ct9H90mP29_16960 [bacterium]